MNDKERIKALNEALSNIDDRYLAEAEPGKRRRLPLYRVAAVAAMLAVVCTLIIPASATEYLHTLFGKWTSELFTFVSGSEDHTIPSASLSAKEYSNPGLAEFAQALENAGITANVVPTWLPEGYILEELDTYVRKNGKTIHVGFAHCEDYITCTVRTLDSVSSIYEKDDRPVTVYENHNVTHYIFNNLDDVTAAWTDGIVECSLSGDVTIEEMQQIINSIYSGGN